HLDAGRLAEAERPIREALKVTKALADAEPTPRNQAFLGMRYHALATLCARTKRLEEAVEHLGTAAKLFDALKDVPRCRAMQAEARSHRANFLGGLGRFAEAVEEFDRAIPLATGPLRMKARLGRLQSLSHLKKTEEALAAAEELLASDGKEAV